VGATVTRWNFGNSSPGGGEDGGTLSASDPSISRTSARADGPPIFGNCGRVGFLVANAGALGGSGGVTFG
jgi:hypothetical protein